MSASARNLEIDTQAPNPNRALEVCFQISHRGISGRIQISGSDKHARFVQEQSSAFCMDFIVLLIL